MTVVFPASMWAMMPILRSDWRCLDMGFSVMNLSKLIFAADYSGPRPLPRPPAEPTGPRWNLKAGASIVRSTHERTKNAARNTSTRRHPLNSITKQNAQRLCSASAMRWTFSRRVIRRTFFVECRRQPRQPAQGVSHGLFFSRRATNSQRIANDCCRCRFTLHRHLGTPHRRPAYCGPRSAA